RDSKAGAFVGRRGQGLCIYFLRVGRSVAHQPSDRRPTRTRESRRVRWGSGRESIHQCHCRERIMMKSTKPSFALKNITESRLFFPLVALSLILLFDLIFVPGFFAIE